MKQTGIGGKKILFVGAGNMAEALVRGVLLARACGPAALRVSDIDANRLKHFGAKYGVAGSMDSIAEIRDADMVVLSVKPQVLPEVLKQIGAAIPGKTLVVSIAAGITTRSIERMLKKGSRVIRVMPNAPALVGQGAAAFARGSRAVDSDADAVSALFGCVGIAMETPERLLDAVTALSGSGPAYVFGLVEAMLKAGKKMGLPADKARTLAIATVEGAARMLGETGLDPEDLICRVASKGGTTEAALGVLRRAGSADDMVRAILAARDRSRELSK